jgi:demethylmenaquinone methyltransferase/2-methoxy-6-polyprenyl-1,4-benzoquinol methylase
VLRAGHAVYFRRVVPAVGGALSDRDAYRYLPASAEYLPAPEEMVSMLEGSGFPGARRVPLAAGVAQLLIGTRA